MLLALLSFRLASRIHCGVSVLVLPFGEFRRIFRYILSTDPDVALDMMAVLSRRLRKVEQRAYE